MYCDRNIYDTTYGKAIKSRDIETRLESYLDIYREDLSRLSFEYRNVNKYEHIFITGRNEEELRLGSFDHPYIIEKHNKLYMVTDLRPFLKKKNDDILNFRLVECFTNPAEGMMRVRRSLIYSDFLSGESGTYISLFNTAIQAMVFIIRHTIKNLTNPHVEELLMIEMITYLYGTLLSTNSTDLEAVKDVTIARLTTNKVYSSLGLEKIRSIILDCPLSEPTIPNLNHTIITHCLKDSSSINQFKDEPRLLMEQVNRLYMGFQSGAMILVAFEHMPTWLSLVYMVGAEIAFRKTTMNQIFKTYAKTLAINEYVTSMSLTLQDRFVKL